MSGHLPTAIAEAAGRHAEAARAAGAPRHPGHAIAERARAIVAARQGTKAESLGASTWRAMHLQARTVLVMLAASDAAGDPREVAAQPWGSFTGRDQAQIGACARELGRNLKNAAYLV